MDVSLNQKWRGGLEPGIVAQSSKIGACRPSACLFFERDEPMSRLLHRSLTWPDNPASLDSVEMKGVS